MLLTMEALLPLLRPPGDGIATVSAGSLAALPLLRRIYQSPELSPAEAVDQWKGQVHQKLHSAKVILLGVPLDTGAGIQRGAAYGPRGIRLALYEDPVFLDWIRQGLILDLGDVFVNPHLLHDQMLTSTQIKECQDLMYPQVPLNVRHRLPVSALSQLRFIIQECQRLNSSAKWMVLGGDHSIAWPISEAVIPRHAPEIGIVQPDAHTDLLESRFGVKYCFGTWSYHANELLGRGGKLLQIGIRVTGREKSHWEGTYGVKQVWAQEVAGREAEVIQEVVAHLKSRGVKKLYFSNDIDGTDMSEAPSTGTPAENGLSSRFLLSLMERLGEEFEWVAADLVEVAPPLGPHPEAVAQTLAVSVRYVLTSLRALLR